MTIGFILTGFIALHFIDGYSAGKALINGAFHIVSIITTTGFYTQDYNLWGSLMLIIIFMLMFSGGTAGSTSGGIKIVRLLLIAKNNRHELKRLLHPNAFIPVRLDKHIIHQTIIYNLLVFITLYFVLICFATLIISFMGYDIITSFSTSASILGNIGPAIGTFGPFTNYSFFPVAGKWFLSALMLLGRLELLTVLLLFTRSFYRN